jgi:hypothetical protein
MLMLLKARNVHMVLVLLLLVLLAICKRQHAEAAGIQSMEDDKQLPSCHG